MRPFQIQFSDILKLLNEGLSNLADCTRLGLKFLTYAQSEL